MTSYIKDEKMSPLGGSTWAHPKNDKERGVIRHRKEQFDCNTCLGLICVFLYFGRDKKPLSVNLGNVMGEMSINFRPVSQSRVTLIGGVLCGTSLSR